MGKEGDLLVCDSITLEVALSWIEEGQYTSVKCWILSEEERFLAYYVSDGVNRYWAYRELETV
jgi:hypothetical protein